MDNMRFNKKEHAIQRFIDRYGYNLSDLEYEELNSQIIEKKAEFLANDFSPLSEIWIVNFQGQKIPCMFCLEAQTIQTFMTKKWVKKLIKKTQRKLKMIEKIKEKRKKVEEFFAMYG
jgi:hypothetical protein